MTWSEWNRGITQALPHQIPISNIKSTSEQEHATPGLFGIAAVTALNIKFAIAANIILLLKKVKLLSTSVELNVEHSTLTNTYMQRAGPAWNASQKDQASGVSERACVQRWVHNDLKREWLSNIDDALEILLWQTPKYGVAYSCSNALLVICFVCLTQASFQF